MAHSSRGWTGARTPSAIKRVRQTQRRKAINQPRRTAAKTLVAKAIVAANDSAANGGNGAEAQLAVERAMSALDRAAKIGAIHPNAAARRKSRMMLKVNAAVAGEGMPTAAKAARTIGKAAAVKEAKARIAASRATKAKGAQTAAGKARAALARTTRETAAEQTAAPTAKSGTETKPAKATKAVKTTGSKAATGKASAKSAASKAAASKPAAKTTASKPAAKASAAKKSSTKK